MAEPTINDYCPPPTPEDYLDGEIQYPTPQGKEWQDSRYPLANDLLIEPDKENKVINVEENSITSPNNLDFMKRTTRLPSRLETKTRKRFRIITAPVVSGKMSNSLELSIVSDKKRNNLI